MDAEPAGWANVSTFEPGKRRPRREALVASRIAALRILLVTHCYFFLGPSAAPAEVGSPGHDPRLQIGAKILETQEKVIWPPYPAARPTSQAEGSEGGPSLFSIVPNNAGCSGSGLATTAHEMTGGSAQFVIPVRSLGMTRHIP